MSGARDQVDAASSTHEQQIDTLRRLYAERQLEFERASRELASGRMKSRCALGVVVLVGLVASAWRLYPVFQAMTRGYVLECPRLSTLGCRQIYMDDAGYWGGVMANSVLGVLFLAATVAALFGLRALFRPAPVLQNMRADVQRMRDRLSALERGEG